LSRIKGITQNPDPQSGTIANRRIFAEVDQNAGAFPDGLTVDADGFVWSNQVGTGRIVRYDPDGKIERAVQLPVPRATGCTFGGDKLDTLYVTSARETMTLRLRPDRIIIGEVRGPEALAMLKAWNTGHPGGVATIHANSATDALRRIEDLVGEASQIVPKRSIASAVNLLVFIERTNTRPGRAVRSIVEVNGFDEGDYVLHEVKSGN
jgi:hypothetical protein